MIFLSLLKESFLFALHALGANKLRTFLSLLGITIGIFAIISVFTIIDSLENNLRKSIATLGDNTVFVQKWPWSFDGGNYPWWKYFNRPVPAIDELDDIQRKCMGAEAAAFIVEFRKTVKFESSSAENVDIVAASHDFDQVDHFELADGRYFSEIESAAGRNVTIIGSAVSEALFPNRYPVGEYIRILGRKIQIIGVFKKEGENMFGGSDDVRVLIPINFARNILDVNDKRLDPYIVVKAKNGVSNDQLIDELTGVMRATRRLKPVADDNFALNQVSIISKGFDGMFAVLSSAGWLIGGLSILVGGFGIANIMFVSVKERTNIIGIQKSLGAKRYFILVQFLSESVILSLIGGAIGLIIVYLLLLLVGDSFGMEITLTTSNIIMGLSISGIIGVISGFIPAWQASRLDPVEAIRTTF